MDPVTTLSSKQLLDKVELIFKNESDNTKPETQDSNSLELGLDLDFLKADLTKQDSSKKSLIR